MLEGNFFESKGLNVGEGFLSASIDFNPRHEIFQGHFPGQPVVPGVCMLQILKEFLQKAVDSKLTLKKASQVKYLALIDPVRFPEIQVEMNFTSQENGYLVSGKLFKEELVFLKFKGEFGLHAETQS